MPKGVKDDFYCELIDIAHAKKATVILDSSGLPLKYGVEAKPYMIKPNEEEIEILAGKPLKNREDYLIQAAKQIANDGIQLVVISRGAKGAIVLDAKSGLLLKASVQNDVCIHLLNSVGCGDALVGGFSIGILHRYSLLETVRLGVACGTASLFTNGPGRCDMSRVRQILPLVKIQTLP